MEIETNLERERYIYIERETNNLIGFATDELQNQVARIRIIICKMSKKLHVMLNLQFHQPLFLSFFLSFAFNLSKSPLSFKKSIFINLSFFLFFFLSLFFTKTTNSGVWGNLK
jgi:hypothetical protein